LLDLLVVFLSYFHQINSEKTTTTLVLYSQQLGFVFERLSLSNAQSAVVTDK